MVATHNVVMWFCTVLQVIELQQRNGRVRTLGHGQADGSGPRSVRAGCRIRLSGEQLRGRTGEIVRIQEIPGTHTQNRRLRIPGRWLAR